MKSCEKKRIRIDTSDLHSFCEASKCYHTVSSRNAPTSVLMSQITSSRFIRSPSFLYHLSITPKAVVKEHHMLPSQIRTYYLYMRYILSYHSIKTYSHSLPSSPPTSGIITFTSWVNLLRSMSVVAVFFPSFSSLKFLCCV